MTHSEPPAQAPANWYPDPWGAAELRYYDGTAWTAHTHSSGAPAGAGAAAPAATTATPSPAVTIPSPPTAIPTAATPTPAAPEPAQLSESDARQGSAKLRRPATQHLTTWSWMLAGIVSVLTPFAIVTILGNQYRRLKSGTGLQGNEWVDTGEQFVADVGGPAFTWVAVLFIAAGVVMLAAYAWVVISVWAGSTAARVVGTVLVALSVPGLLSASFVYGRLQAMFFWANIGALRFIGTAFLIVLLLHLVGVCCAWLPPTNAYARQRAQTRLARRAAEARTSLSSGGAAPSAAGPHPHPPQGAVPVHQPQRSRAPR